MIRLCFSHTRACLYLLLILFRLLNSQTVCGMLHNWCPGTSSASVLFYIYYILPSWVYSIISVWCILSWFCQAGGIVWLHYPSLAWGPPLLSGLAALQCAVVILEIVFVSYLHHIISLQGTGLPLSRLSGCISFSSFMEKGCIRSKIFLGLKNLKVLSFYLQTCLIL